MKTPLQYESAKLESTPSRSRDIRSFLAIDIKDNGQIETSPSLENASRLRRNIRSKLKRKKIALDSRHLILFYLLVTANAVGPVESTLQVDASSLCCVSRWQEPQRNAFAMQQTAVAGVALLASKTFLSPIYRLVCLASFPVAVDDT